jgi:putative membrane protein
VVGVATKLLATCAVNCAGLLAAAAIVPHVGYDHRWQTLVLAGLILGIVNFLVRPLVIVMTFPAVILSLGLALLLVNALMLWLTTRIVTGLHTGGFFSTVAGALIVWIVNVALRGVLRAPRAVKHA